MSKLFYYLSLKIISIFALDEYILKLKIPSWTKSKPGPTD